MRVLFVDNRPEEIASLWAQSGLAPTDECLNEAFVSLEQTLERIAEEKPDVVAVGFNLGRGLDITGDHVITAAQAAGFLGFFVLNSGGGSGAFPKPIRWANKSADRDPDKLKQLVGKFRFPLTCKRGAMDEVRKYLVIAEGEDRPAEAAEILVVNARLGNDTPKTVVDAVLELFLSTASSSDSSAHQTWVHSLSHFTEKLWELRQVEWLQRLYKAAVSDSRSTENWNCVDRLVREFVELGEFSDRASDFGLGEEIVESMYWNGSAASVKEREFILARVRADAFPTLDEWEAWRGTLSPN